MRSVIAQTSRAEQFGPNIYTFAIFLTNIVIVIVFLGVYILFSVLRFEHSQLTHQTDSQLCVHVHSTWVVSDWLNSSRGGTGSVLLG